MIGSLVPVEGPAAWRGSRIDYRAEGLHVLSGAEVREIDDALAQLRSRGEIDFADIDTETFPLPTLGQQFDRLGHDLRNGRGFLLLRGLPRERYSADDLRRLCLSPHGA